MEDKQYNGWTNYATWSVNLWIDNDEGTQNYWSECADELQAQDDDDLIPDWCAADAMPDWHTPHDERSARLATMLQEQHEEESPTQGASVYSDLLGAALGSVNWREIAESMMDEARDRNPKAEESEEVGS